MQEDKEEHELGRDLVYVAELGGDLVLTEHVREAAEAEELDKFDVGMQLREEPQRQEGNEIGHEVGLQVVENHGLAIEHQP